jgi:hypothetical protein
VNIARASGALYSLAVQSVVSPLIDAVSKIGQAIEGATTSLAAAGVVCDDIPVIRDQSTRAVGTVSTLQRIVSGDGEREKISELLHQINNQLTGILSLTLLVKDDLAPDHPSRTSLDAVDEASRDAADLVKKVAAALKKS